MDIKRLSSFPLFKKQPTEPQVGPVNQAKAIKEYQKYNVMVTIDREISHVGSFLTFDQALECAFSVFSDELTNDQANELEERFEPNHRRFTLSGKSFGIEYDRSKNIILAWGNAKKHIDISVLVF